MVTGTGASNNPFVLSSFSDLELIGTTGYSLSSYYVLGDNIDASLTSSPEYNGGSGWVPIGTPSSPFSGNFNGNGYTISNLYINLPTTNYVGLFGYSIGLITNLTMQSSNITGQSNVGSVVGYIDIYGKTISQINVIDSSITASSNYCGGILGYSPYHYPSSSVQNCSVTNSTITGTTYVGGIGGAVSYFNVTNCTVNSIINGTNSVGGMFGQYGNSGSHINGGSVSGTITNSGSNTGGVVGQIYACSYIQGITINNDLTITTSSTSDNVGGIVGYGPSATITTSITSCTVNTNISGRNYVGGVCGNFQRCIYNTVSVNCTVSGVNYVGMITGLWGSGTTLSSFGTNITASGTINGSGTAIGGFIGLLPSNGPLTGLDNSNIIFGDTSSASRVGGIVGYHSSGNYTINITSCISNTPISGSSYVGGIIGQANQGTISNCTVLSSVTGTTYVGGIEGYSYYSNTIHDCTVKADISASSNIVGGILGGTQGSTTAYYINIYNCIYQGNVTGNGYVGGIGGRLESYKSGSKVSVCYTTGTIVSTSAYTGGISGYNRIPISNCYSKMSVIGTTNCGGLIGIQVGSTVSTNYSCGSVSGTGIGGLAGVKSGTVTDTNNFWDTQTSGCSTSALGIGQTTIAMKLQDTYTSWDFTTIWSIGSAYNEGYPYLQALPVPASTIILTETAFDLSILFSSPGIYKLLSCNNVNLLEEFGLSAVSLFIPGFVPCFCKVPRNDKIRKF